MASRAKAILRAGLLFVLPTLVVCVAMLEVGLRLQGAVPSNTTDGIFQKYGKTYRLRPNMTKLARTPSYSCTIVTNSFGLRDHATGERRLGPMPYIAFLGDSITFGNGVDYDESLVGVFARSAARRGYDVVNLAVGGHRFTDQEAVLEDLVAIAPQPPALVVVVVTKEFITGFERDSSGLLVKDGYLFDADRWLVPYLTVKLGDASAAYGFFRDNVRRIQGRLSPATRDDAVEFLRDFSRTGPWASTELVRRFDGRLARLDERVRSAGGTPVYVYMPVSPDLLVDQYLAAAGRPAGDYDFDRFFAIIKNHADRADIQVVDLRPVLKRLQASGEPVAFMQDPHYNVHANRVIGDALVAALLGHGGPRSPTSD